MKTKSNSYHFIKWSIAVIDQTHTHSQNGVLAYVWDIQSHFLLKLHRFVINTHPKFRQSEVALYSLNVVIQTLPCITILDLMLIVCFFSFFTGNIMCLCNTLRIPFVTDIKYIYIYSPDKYISKNWLLNGINFRRKRGT